MALTVFAESMGLFHKGSGGKGIAPLDFCLSPPPPPAGPIPIPYVNLVQASDLSKGSKTVKIDGEPTALEDASYVSTSTGDEMGTQGGSVITAKTKGKGYFALWSFTVQIEGKGVCRHGDPMGQNCASMPPGCMNMAAIVDFIIILGSNAMKECEEAYVRKDEYGPTDDQQAETMTGPCWECGKKISGKIDSSFVPDHQPPLAVAWRMGGCHLGEDNFKKWATSKHCVVSHCLTCSKKQMSVARWSNQAKIKDWIDNTDADLMRKNRKVWPPKKTSALLEELGIP